MSKTRKGKSFIGGAANQTFNGNADFKAVSYAQATNGIIADLSTGIVTREFTPSTENPLKILPLGDSITVGLVNTEAANKPAQDNDTGGYRNFLNQSLIGDGFGEAVDFVGSQKKGSFGDNEHEGHSGRTVQYISDRIVGWLNPTQPDIVLLMIGTNDTGNSNISQADERLSVLIDKITNHPSNPHVLVASIPPIDPNFELSQSNNAKTYNAQIPGILWDKLTQGNKVSFVDPTFRTPVVVIGNY